MRTGFPVLLQLRCTYTAVPADATAADQFESPRCYGPGPTAWRHLNPQLKFIPASSKTIKRQRISRYYPEMAALILPVTLA